MREVKVPKLEIDFSASKKKGSQIERAIESVGKIDHTFGVMKPDCYLKRHSKKTFNIDLD